MDIDSKIKWLEENEEKIFTGFDRIFIDTLIKQNTFDDKDFMKYYTVALENFKEFSDLNLDEQTRISFLERIRSNVVREQYMHDPLWIKASMAAYIQIIINALNNKHNEILNHLLSDMDSIHTLQKNQRMYLVEQIISRSSNVMAFARIMYDIERGLPIDKADYMNIKECINGSNSYKEYMVQ